MRRTSKSKASHRVTIFAVIERLPRQSCTRFINRPRASGCRASGNINRPGSPARDAGDGARRFVRASKSLALRLTLRIRKHRGSPFCSACNQPENKSQARLTLSSSKTDTAIPRLIKIFVLKSAYSTHDRRFSFDRFHSIGIDK